MFFGVFLKPNYEVFTPIYLKTNNKKPNYFIVHLHKYVSLVHGSKRIHIYNFIFIYIRCILKLW